MGALGPSRPVAAGPASFAEALAALDWDREAESIRAKTAADVERALQGGRARSVEDFKALVSESAAPYLEAMARAAQESTLRRFGRAVRMYVPVYLSNVCHNRCRYCGFALGNEIPRVILTDAQIRAECGAVRAMGYRHVLFVTGESNEVRLPYFLNALSLARPIFDHITLESQPLDEADYAALGAAGLHAVSLYQETYRRATWREYHPAGNKSRFEWRLGTPERAARAGIRKFGLGVLVGLEDWRADSVLALRHLAFLRARHPRMEFSISFPRMRPAEGGIEPKVPISDREFVQLMCAWRLADPCVEALLSTREAPAFRDAVFPLATTHLSAGSRTNPGGYTCGDGVLPQFESGDERSAAEVAGMLAARGYRPVWKDWDASLSGPP
ncbi:MAG: 2-iminoacetate synthase ThiH [Spirochaetes bacterium]|nr:2-iminoacetate synthase ThiH [Spirochaetota bacterium]